MRLSCVLFALAIPAVSPAQSSPLSKAAATITEGDVRRRINIIADDSMGGRNTPSPGLDKAARYIESEFQRLGLKPGGDSGTYLLRYPADMIGRNWKDTIVAIGKEHSDLGATLNRVNGAHPELIMHAIDDRWPDESFYTRSDHFNFAQKGVPILFFFNGVHEDYHRAGDSPDKLDAEKESRIVKLLFYVGQDVANARQRPQWVPSSYKQIVIP